LIAVLDAALAQVPDEFRRGYPVLVRLEGAGASKALLAHRLGRFPSRRFAINTAWLACTLTAIDLIAWTQTILLTDQPELARAEPKTLRYRLRSGGPTDTPRCQRCEPAQQRAGRGADDHITRIVHAGVDASKRDERRRGP
jgi:hypothetical protein